MRREFFSEGVSLTNKRQINMDCLLLCQNTGMDIPIFLAAVCDGVGSTCDGAYASAQTLKMLQQWFYSLEHTRSIGLNFLLSMKKINIELSRQIIKNRLEAATTFSAILLADDQYYLVHVGDSRIYGWRDGNLEQLTQDCVSDRGELCSYLGREKSAAFMYYEGKNSYEKYLLCTDGLYKRMDRRFLTEQLERAARKNLKKTLKILTDAVVSNGEQDNITAALIINERGGER